MSTLISFGSGRQAGEHNGVMSSPMSFGSGRQAGDDGAAS